MLQVVKSSDMTSWSALQEVYRVMLSSHLDTQYPEMREVLAHHVVPLLRLQDAQALAQTCGSLRKLIIAGLPASGWASLVHDTCLSASPILTADSTHIYSELLQLANFHASV